METPSTLQGKVHLILTKPQFKALLSLVNTCEAVMEGDIITDKEIKLIDRMLKNNNHRR